MLCVFCFERLVVCGVKWHSFADRLESASVMIDVFTCISDRKVGFWFAGDSIES